MGASKAQKCRSRIRRLARPLPRRRNIDFRKSSRSLRTHHATIARGPLCIHLVRSSVYNRLNVSLYKHEPLHKKTVRSYRLYSPYNVFLHLLYCAIGQTSSIRYLISSNLARILLSKSYTTIKQPLISLNPHTQIHRTLVYNGTMPPLISSCLYRLLL